MYAIKQAREEQVMTVVACEQILAKLGEAVELAVNDLPANLGRFRDMLSDLVYRVEAAEMAMAVGVVRPGRAA